jgi:hypothetical protein
MTLTLPGAIEYREGGYREVPGWLRSIDIELFDRILAAQLEHDIKGHMLEIGCYEGKSAIMLGYGLRENERLTVCDLFEIPPGAIPVEGLDAYQGLTADSFRRRYMVHHSTGPVIYGVASNRLRDHLQVRQFRFIHIDGGHAYSVVAYDIDTAVAVAAPDCVVVLDDYRSPHTPGVAAAFWSAVGRRDLYPFLLSEGKAYCATTRSSQRWWVDVVQRFGYPSEEHHVHGTHIHRVSCATPCSDHECARCRADEAVNA